MNKDDSLSRAEALDTKNSFCVIAPAGSGKTEILIQRILKLLSFADRPESILAITFTRKAADEMIDRIIRSLESAFNDERPTKEHELKTWHLSKDVLKRSKEKNWNLLQSPFRLRIQTIDSFCQTIVNDLPILSGFSGGVSPTENPDLLYSLAVDNLFSEVDPGSNIVADLDKILVHFDNDFNKLKNLLIEMIKCRDQWLPYAVNINSKELTDLNINLSLQKWFSEKLNDARSVFISFEHDLVKIINFTAKFRSEYNDDSDELISQLTQLKSLPDFTKKSYHLWAIIFNLFFTSDHKLRKALTKKIGFPPKSQASNKDERSQFEYHKNLMKSLVDSITNDDLELLLPIAKVINFDPSNQDWNIVSSICNCLVHLYAELRLVFSRENVCDFLEINNSALNALSASNTALLNDESIRYKWDSGLNHILIDEFQDTSVAQFSLIEKLTEEWHFYNNSNVDKKTLFIVGDPMQSIYSFRAAKVGLFLQAREYGISHIKLKYLELRANFRSNKNDSRLEQCYL